MLLNDQLVGKEDIFGCLFSAIWEFVDSFVEAV